jgi:hypothetical protein
MLTETCVTKLLILGSASSIFLGLAEVFGLLMSFSCFFFCIGVLGLVMDFFKGLGLPNLLEFLFGLGSGGKRKTFDLGFTEVFFEVFSNETSGRLTDL